MVTRSTLKKLDAKLLVRLGYKSLTADQFNELLVEFYHAAEEIVGVRIASQMSEKQLDEFERFFDAGDNTGALEWLEKHFPNYKDDALSVVSELETVLAETARNTRRPQTPSSGTSEADAYGLVPKAAPPEQG